MSFEEQTEWLRHARRSSGSGTTRVLVVTPVDSAEVVAYYAWCTAGVALADAPERLRKGAGRYPQPVALLARLGIALEHECHGPGAGRVQDGQMGSVGSRHSPRRSLLVAPPGSLMTDDLELCA